jgi:hypothetical protein
MEVTKANLATYLAGLAPSATPYPIEITETVASDWGSSITTGTVGNLINNNTPSGVYLDLGLTIIPSSVTRMDGAFNNCTSLTTAPAIPSSVTNVSYTFYGCTSLTTAPVIPSSVTAMTDTFSFCTSLTTAPIIPSNVTNMDGTFRDCTALTTAPAIPNSVTDMSYAFYNCTSLHTIQNFAVDVDNCYMANAFQNCTALANIYVTTLSESSWHLLHTNTDATGTDYTIYNPDGTVAGSGTVAGTSQVLTLYGKSDELVISANITPTLAEETATSQVQWHKSGLPYDDELMIFNAKNPTTVISNLLITTLRYSASFTLPTYLDGQKIRIANTHATNTITCTLPTGQTMNGQSSFTIAPDTLLEFELIGTAWKCVSNEWEFVAEFLSASTTLNVSVAQYRKIQIILFNSVGFIISQEEAIINDIINNYLTTAINVNSYGATYRGGASVQINASKIIVNHNIYDFLEYIFGKTKIYGMK